MPHLKPPRKTQPLAKQWDQRAQKCGLRHTVYSVNGDQYTGEWLDNRKHGKGTHVWKKDGAIYDGDWKHGKRDGYGTYSRLLPGTNQYIREYSGGWKNGKKHGYGTCFYSSCVVYDGEWSEGLRSVWGRMYYGNGDIYEGEWLKDKRHGQGMLQLANENRYEGSWKDGEKSGHGTFYFLDTGQLYRGFWRDGVAKCGSLSDCGREEAPAPSKYPIPQVQLLDTELVLMEAQSAYQNQS